MKGKLLYTNLLLLLIASCSPQPGIYIGDGGKTTIHFNTIALKYDFSQKFQTSFIESDCEEFMRNHNIQSDSKYSGTIDNLKDIYYMIDGIEDSRKPSITLTMNCTDTTITKKFNNEDVGPWDLFQITYREDVYTGTVEIKSCKTSMYGLQVVWKKSASGPNWPINEFVQNGTISGTAPGIVKGGTNNNNGNVATRNGEIIRNTGDRYLLPIENENLAFIAEEAPVISPALCKNVYIGGNISSNVEWDQPAIYKAL